MRPARRDRYDPDMDRAKWRNPRHHPFGGVTRSITDPTSNRYFLPARHFVKGGTAAASGFSRRWESVDGANAAAALHDSLWHRRAFRRHRQHLGQVEGPFSQARRIPNGGISVFLNPSSPTRIVHG